MLGKLLLLSLMFTQKINITYRSFRIETLNMLREVQFFLFIVYFLEGQA
jgi:hypothetical protein